MRAVAARVEAQAKINLFLRVIAREVTGYHQIETLFCRLALADHVMVRPTAAGRSLRCTGEWVPAGAQGSPRRNPAWRAAAAYAAAVAERVEAPELGPPEQNLAWKAAVGYSDAAEWPAGFEIEVEKRIPVGGGLGGGSADAGAVLRALNALNPEPLAPDALLAIAGSLGADVPFLTQDVSPLALAWGRGDRMVTLPHLPARDVLLHVPAVGVSTADAYRWLDEHPPRNGPATVPLEALSSWEGVACLAGNDFEEPISRQVAAVGDLLAASRGGQVARVFGDAEIVQMTGSGSTVFRVAKAAGRRAKPLIGPWQQDGTTIDLIETRSATFVEPVVLTH
ncbi:MAG TPA: hypothetical protein VF981_15505 [Gemmatimonadaceae bacterium]